jgi:N-acetyl-gamma-glutamyl-phosphate reductase
MGVTVAVAGASGYAGGELLRLVAGHAEFEVSVVQAHTHAGTAVSAVHPHLLDLDLTFTATDPDALAGADVVFLSLPHGESAALAARLPAHVKVVDLGADHRLRDAAAWAAYYGGAHVGAWTYGLPELPGQREIIAASDRVAAGGCYAVATTLALAPLIASGITSADDVVAYKVGVHQHTPEIKQATGARTLSFTPVLVPMPRGILATTSAVPATAGTSPAGVREVLLEAYAREPFVRVLPDGVWPRTAATLGSNACHLQAGVDADSGRVVVVSAIDNLGKGAAGQAVQCANLMLGLPETAGLTAIGVTP